MAKAPTTMTDEAAEGGPTLPAGTAEPPHDLRITSRRDGFRRGGIAHPAEPTPRRSAYFTREQARQILAEPTLVVELRDPVTGDWRIVDPLEVSDWMFDT